MNDFTLRQFLSLYKEKNINMEYVMSYHQMQVKPHELEDFGILCEEILKVINNDIDIDGWYLGTDIRVVPDFDVLRFTDEVITNIELKHTTFESTDKNRLMKKFKSQKHILQLFKIQFQNFVFFAENREFFYYELENDILKKISIQEFVKLSGTYYNSRENRIDDLTPKEYLISPLDDMDNFFDGVYYLTHEQQSIVDKIISKNGIFGVTGIPGSGKTLIAYDLLRRIDGNAKVLMIFCGKLREQHKEMETRFSSIKFLSTKDVEEETLNGYDYVILDESQRIYSEKFSLIRGWGERNAQDKTIVYFFDCEQILSPKDIGIMLNSYFTTLQNDGKGEYLKLSENIRSNKYIASFVKQLQNLSKCPKNDIDILELRNKIEVRFFSNADSAKPWIKSLQKQGYSFIAPTGDRYNIASVDEFIDVIYMNTHNVIGSEVDYVVTYIDSNVYYSNRGILNKANREYYHLEKEIYVNISRAREKLALAIIGNHDVYSAIMEVIFKFKK